MKESQKFVEDLSNGFSTQSKMANNFWLVLIVSSIIVIIGHRDSSNLIELPFTLGKVISSDFYSVSLILICVITIIFSAAMTQMLRTRILVQKAIEDLPESDRFIGRIHIQDYFDSIATPNYTRVAPISQYILGKNQFFGNNKPNPFLKIFATILYVILKLAVFVFLYIIPTLAVKKCWKNLDLTSDESTIHVNQALLFSLILLAGISMLILFIGDIKSIIRVIRRLTR